MSYHNVNMSFAHQCLINTHQTTKIMIKMSLAVEQTINMKTVSVFTLLITDDDYT